MCVDRKQGFDCICKCGYVKIDGECGTFISMFFIWCISYGALKRITGTFVLSFDSASSILQIIWTAKIMSVLRIIMPFHKRPHRLWIFGEHTLNMNTYGMPFNSKKSLISYLKCLNLTRMKMENVHEAGLEWVATILIGQTPFPVITAVRLFSGPD